MQLMNYKELKKKNRSIIDSYKDEPTARVDFYPAYIQLEQTNRCNAECIMCNHFYLGNKGCGDLSAAVIDKIESILPYCETIMLNGDGEPFLCESIERNLDRFSNYEVKIGTNTNLCYIPDGVWKYFDSTFGFLNISCDGGTANTFETIRKGLSFTKFLNNLTKLNEVAPNLKKNFDCVVMKQNINDIPLIVKLAAEFGISAVKFQRLGVNPIIGNDYDQAEYYFDLLEDKLFEARQLGNEYGIFITAPQYRKASKTITMPALSDMVNELSIRKEKARAKANALSLNNDYYSEYVVPEDFTVDTWDANKACQWAIERCYIDLKGNVTTCCYNMKKNMGSLLNCSFEEIWNGPAYIELRKMMANHRLPDFCKQCNWIKEAVF